MDIVSDDRPVNHRTLPLASAHLAELRASGLTDETIRAANVYTETNAAAIGELLGWKGPARTLGACLAFPFTNAAGEQNGYAVVKPTHPLCDKKGKPRKYESPKGQSLRAYIPPGTLAALADATIPLLITEGVKKALAADQHGFPCIGLSGVYGWQSKREERNGKKVGKRKLIPDLAGIAWKGRAVHIGYDSDLAENESVRWAEYHLAGALRAEGAEVMVVRLPSEPDGAKNGLDDFLVRHGREALASLIDAAEEPSRPTETATGCGDGGEKPKAPPAAEVLTEIGLGYELWHTEDGTGFASCDRRSLPIRSKGFRHLLVQEFRTQTGKVPNAEALANAITAIEAAAVYDGPLHTAFVRVAQHEGNVYLHLADDADTVVEIDATGWRVCENPPVRFRRTSGMLALPMPEAGGQLDTLREHINVPDNAAFALVKAWATATLRPAGPFPAIVLLGEQGSAKTTTARVLKALIDPSAAPVRSEPKEVRDLMIAARGNWILALDNLSHLPAWLSDALCRLATGGGFSTRELYTNDDEVIFDAKRPAILNGITEFVERPDLLERSLLVRHPPITEDRRRPESELWARFHRDHPKLLGALLTRVSAGLRELPRTRLERLPRMADFALFAVACERGANELPVFFSAYAENQSGAHEQTLEDSPLAAAIVAWMSDRNEWAGKPRELLTALTAAVGEAASAKEWPKGANALTGKLRRLAPSFRRVYGLNVDCDSRDPDRKRSRRVHVTKQADRQGDLSSAPSAPSETLQTPALQANGDIVRTPSADRPQSASAPLADDETAPTDDDAATHRPARKLMNCSGSDDADDADDVSPDVSDSPSPRRYANDDRPHGWRD